MLTVLAEPVAHPIDPSNLTHTLNTPALKVTPPIFPSRPLVATSAFGNPEQIVLGTDPEAIFNIKCTYTRPSFLFTKTLCSVAVIPLGYVGLTVSHGIVVQSIMCDYIADLT